MIFTFVNVQFYKIRRTPLASNKKYCFLEIPFLLGKMTTPCKGQSQALQTHHPLLNPSLIAWIISGVLKDKDHCSKLMYDHSLIHLRTRWFRNFLIIESHFPGLRKSVREFSSLSSIKSSLNTRRSDALAVANRRGICNNEVDEHTCPARGNDQSIHETYLDSKKI